MQGLAAEAPEDTQGVQVVRKLWHCLYQVQCQQIESMKSAQS